MEMDAAIMFALAAATVVALTFVVAPYGRHARRGWGPSVPGRIGWMFMESPAVLAFLAFYLQGSHRAGVAPLVLLGLWLTHYVHRAFVFPLGIPGGAARMPLVVAALGFGFNVFNAWLNARWISELGAYPATWLFDPRFACGALVFLFGLGTNVHADRCLRALRAPGETGYKIPRGGLYEYVSSPNYLGEIVEWLGWAIATWSLPGLAFAVYTIANLGPRALHHHAWYRRTFPDYPRRRKALVPFVL
jgi:protein-S-isoprenylcysteine O-methyltransferase Ste14